MAALTTQTTTLATVPGATSIAADQVGTANAPAAGDRIQYVKLDLGAAGASSPAVANVPISAASLPLPAGASQDGTDMTTPVPAMPAGGVGIRGWLSAIWTKINGSLAVTGTFWQATQPVSGTFWQATQPVSATALPLPTGAAIEAGHLATIDTSTAKIPAQGQALAAASTPVVLTAIQAAALTPPAAIAGFALEAGHLATIDTSTAKIPALGQALAASSVPVVLTAAQQTALTPPAAITGFALEAGHLASLDTKAPALGQALAAASVPVILPSATVTTLTPPVAITGFALEAGHLATIDTSTAKIPSQGQALAAASLPVVLTAIQVTTLTPPTTVTSNQGTANATPWNDNVAQIAGTAAVNPSAQAGAWFTQRRSLNTYTAVYRLAARPYAISKTFTAGSRFQFATIHHAATAVKTVKLKRVEIALESSSVAGITMADLMRITAAPATGNPAITPSPTNPANAAAESTCLTLPTTAGTEGAVHSTLEWNLGITGAASVANPPPALNWYTLWPQTQGATESDENQYPTIRSGVLEGFAVTLDCNAASVVKGYVVIEFTEE